MGVNSIGATTEERKEEEDQNEEGGGKKMQRSDSVSMQSEAESSAAYSEVDGFEDAQDGDEEETMAVEELNLEAGEEEPANRDQTSPEMDQDGSGRKPRKRESTAKGEEEIQQTIGAEKESSKDEAEVEAPSSLDPQAQTPSPKPLELAADADQGQGQTKSNTPLPDGAGPGVVGALLGDLRRPQKLRFVPPGEVAVPPGETGPAALREGESIPLCELDF